MSSEDNHHPLKSDDHDKQRAAEFLRGKINKLYDHNPPNQLKAEELNPYHKTHDENIDLSNYHSAWQNYYQQYYHRYYWQELHKERQRITNQHADIHHVSEVVAGIPTKLKGDLLDKVKDSAIKFKRSSHFIPILSALFVGGVFLFLQFNSVFIAQVKAYISPGALSSDSVVIDPTANIKVDSKPRLIIPKINVDVPVNYDINVIDENILQNGLRDSAVHYKLPNASSLPGQFGNTVIIGHSGNDIFNAGDYKFVFVLLDKMEKGDVLYAHYKGKRYTYKVTDMKVIDPSDVKALQIGRAKPYLTLITCTPPGTALKRLLLIAEQISPDPSASTQPKQTSASADQPLVGTEKTLFDRLFDLFR